MWLDVIREWAFLSFILTSVWFDHQKHKWIKADEFSRSKCQFSFKHLQETLSGVLVFLLL